MNLNVPLGDTQEVRWVDGLGGNYDLEKLVIDGVTVWQKIREITGTATYDPITRKVTYQITGDIAGFTKWSYQAIRQGDSYDTGEVVTNITSGPPEVNGTIVLSNVLDVSDDGTWDVAFRGYEGNTLRGESTTTATVATPFVEITSVVELTSAPAIAVGDVLGMGVWGVENEPYDDDSDRDYFRYVVLDGIFDSVDWPADGYRKREGRTSKTFQGLIDDYGFWTPGSTGNQASGYTGIQKSAINTIIGNIPTSSTAYAWQMIDIDDYTNSWTSKVRDFASGQSAVGFQFTATIGGTTYTLGVTKASVYSGVINGQASPYIRPASGANSFWQEDAWRLGQPIDNFDIYEIEVIS